MRVILSEILSTEYVLSTPFTALLGRVPVTVYAVLERTAVLVIMGEEQKRVVRHDILTVETDSKKLRARPTPTIDRIHRARITGRENSHKRYEENGYKNGHEESLDYQIEDQIRGSKYDPVAKLEDIAAQGRSQES